MIGRKLMVAGAITAVLVAACGGGELNDGAERNCGCDRSSIGSVVGGS